MKFFVLLTIIVCSSINIIGMSKLRLEQEALRVNGIPRILPPLINSFEQTLSGECLFSDKNQLLMINNDWIDARDIVKAIAKKHHMFFKYVNIVADGSEKKEPCYAQIFKEAKEFAKAYDRTVIIFFHQAQDLVSVGNTNSSLSLDHKLAFKKALLEYQNDSSVVVIVHCTELYTLTHDFSCYFDFTKNMLDENNNVKKLIFKKRFDGGGVSIGQALFDHVLYLTKDKKISDIESLAKHFVHDAQRNNRVVSPDIVKAYLPKFKNVNYYSIKILEASNALVKNYMWLFLGTASCIYLFDCIKKLFVKKANNKKTSPNTIISQQGL